MDQYGVVKYSYQNVILSKARLWIDLLTAVLAQSGFARLVLAGLHYFEVVTCVKAYTKERIPRILYVECIQGTREIASYAFGCER